LSRESQERRAGRVEQETVGSGIEHISKFLTLSLFLKYRNER
jgi:hypothetical protein